MPAKRGRLFIVKVGGGGSPETFTQVSGQRSTAMTLANEMVDISNKDTGAWRKLGGDMGIRSMSITLSGVFQDAVNEETLRGYAAAGTIDTYQLIEDTGDKWQGDFQVSSFARSGEYNGAQLYDVTLESADVITFTAA